MAASLPSFFSIKARGAYLKRCNIRRGLQVIRVQNYQDEGRLVDANLSVLKERIEMVKVKGKLERCCKCQHGWNYVPISDNDHKTKRNKELCSLIELAALAFGTLGLTCFSGTLFLCLVSLLLHLQL